MPRKLSNLGMRVAHWIEGAEWAATKGSGLTSEAKGLPDWRIDKLSSERADGPLGSEMEKRVGACAYDFGIERGSVRAVLAVLLRDALITAEGRTPPAPTEDAEEDAVNTGEPGWRKALGAGR